MKFGDDYSAEPTTTATTTTTTMTLDKDARYFKLLEEANEKISTLQSGVVGSMLQSLVVHSQFVPELLEDERFVAVLGIVGG